jgi:hypothetical protein
MIEILKLWLPVFVEENNQISKQKQPPMQPCTPINPHFNMKLLKTHNSRITPQYPWCNSWNLDYHTWLCKLGSQVLTKNGNEYIFKWNLHAINEITQHALGDPIFFFLERAKKVFWGFWCSHMIFNYAPNVCWCVFQVVPNYNTALYLISFAKRFTFIINIINSKQKVV